MTSSYSLSSLASLSAASFSLSFFSWDSLVLAARAAEALKSSSAFFWEAATSALL